MKRSILLIAGSILAACSGSQPGRARPPSSAQTTANRKPVIESLSTIPAFVPAGGSASTRATATDPDFDRLVYQWNIQGGKILSGGETPLISWVADDDADEVVISVSVKDRAQFVERTEKITLTHQELEIIIVPPLSVEEGETYLVQLKTRGVETLSGAFVRVLFPSSALRLQSVGLIGLSAQEQSSWTVLTDLAKPGTLDIALVSHGREERVGGSLLVIRYELRDNALPEEGSIGFATAAKNQGIWDSKGQPLQVAYIDPSQQGEIR
ncbi:hypothetical protein H8D30_03115 [bacterium]|nr:hypothetical protein [bacterium]